MNISYNWLKRYIATDLPAEKIAEILTDIGLEVEGFEKIETVKGGLRGVVVGEVVTCADHPDSDTCTSPRWTWEPPSRCRSSAAPRTAGPD